MIYTKKFLGQHWLADEATLDYIVSQADIQLGDTILEVGPGTGNLTGKLLAAGAEVVAVEKDETLADRLPEDRNLKVITADILEYDLSKLPSKYKVVANIPYYLTSNLLRRLSESANPPSKMVLLVQREVAERVCAQPGDMSLLSVAVQLYYDCHLGKLVPAELFQPPPEVDSQIIILNRHPDPLFEDLETKKFFKLVRAGFSERRKKLRSSLSGGLGIDKAQADKLLNGAGIDGARRAQELSLHEWYQLYKNF